MFILVANCLQKTNMKRKVVEARRQKSKELLEAEGMSKYEKKRKSLYEKHRDF